MVEFQEDAARSTGEQEDFYIGKQVEKVEKLAGT